MSVDPNRAEGKELFRGAYMCTSRLIDHSDHPQQFQRR